MIFCGRILVNHLEEFLYMKNDSCFGGGQRKREDERRMETESAVVHSGRYCSMIKLFMAWYHEVGKNQTFSRDHDMLDKHLSTSETCLELTTDQLYPGTVHVQKKRTHSLNTFIEPP